MIALAEPDRLALEAELAEVVAILMDGLDDHGAGGLALSTLQAYAKRIDNFEQQAHAHGLQGLRQVCQILQRRLNSYQDASSNTALREVLEEWPVLAMGYLADPTDEQYVDILLENLQSPAWGDFLNHEIVSSIRQAFLNTDVTLSLDTVPQESENTHAKALFTSESDDAQADDLFISASDDQADSLFMPGTDNQADDLFTSASDDQADSLFMPGTDNQADNLFTSASDDQADSLFMPGTDNQADDLFASASDDQADSLFTSESDDAQVDLVSDFAPSTPASSAATKPMESNPSESLQSDIAGLLEILTPALEDTSPATLNPILSQFAEQLQVIGNDAAEAGVLGFYDLCILFSEQLNNISEREDDCTPEEFALLEEWPTLAMLYLENPQDPANAQALLEHMQNSAWRASLPAEEVQILRDLLAQIPDDTSTTPSIAEDAEGPQAETNSDEHLSWAAQAGIDEAAPESLFVENDSTVPDWTSDEAIAESSSEPNQESESEIAAPSESGETQPGQTQPGETQSDKAGDEVSVVSTFDYSNTRADKAPLKVDEIPEETEAAFDDNALESADTIVYPSDDMADSADDLPPDVHAALPEDFGTAEPALPVQTTAEISLEDESTVAISDDLLDILRAELAEIAEAGEHSLGIVQESASSEEQRQQALEDYTEELERLSMAADSIGLQGLGQLCAQLHANLDAFAARQQVLSNTECRLLNDWQQPVLAYLEAIGAAQPSQDLIAFMQQPDWLLPLDNESAAELLQALRNPSPSLEDFGEVEARQTTAHPADVSLELPPDTNQELVDSLLQELPNQTSDFTAAIQKLYEGQGTMADMESAQRIAHTLKGAGNTVGVAGIANITHHIEDILIALGKEHSMPTRNLAGTLMDAADCLETMSESLLGVSEPPPQAQTVLQSILDLANRIDRDGVPSILADDSAIKPADFSALNQAEPTTASTEPVATGHEETAPVPMVRVPAPLIDELLRLVGESIILTGQIQERIRANMTQARLIRQQNQTLQQLVNELEQLVDVQGVGMPTMHGGATGSGGAASHFDPLEMDQYNELHTVTRRLVEAAADANALDEGISDNFAELETLMSDQTQVHRDSQEAVMRTRMVPIQTVVPRLQRTVRQTGRLTDKEVELSIKGSNTLIDSNVLSDMLDPLMHVLRNAIDHGIEAPDIRQSRQKPAVGQIQLSFQREGNSIVVRCQDDGGGLNLEGIRSTAEQRGLVLPGQALSEDELTRLILQPGFSTRTQATQVSGRGIGLDAVYSEVLKLKGSLTIHSKAGLGCTLEMRLPVTLISAHALLVRCNQDVFAVAERGIEQLVHATTGQVIKTDTGLVYQLEDRQFDIIQLETLLGLPVSDDDTALMKRPALLARDETGGIKAIMVEEMIDSRDLVVKPMGHFAPKVKGILGATILGDGSITPVLDMPELLRSTGASNIVSDTASAIVARPAVTPQPSKPKVLVVDDSLSVRRTMQQLISDAGFDVMTARDGLEAVSILNSDKPSIMLVDMEMPRMNGLELTLHARAQAATRDLPILMITSRSTVKHRQEAEAAGVSAYLTKPVADDELISYINQMVAA